LLAESRDKHILPTAMVSAVTCPVCGEAVPVAEVAAHEHFAPVPG
jgi:hypothetical protein